MQNNNRPLYLITWLGIIAWLLIKAPTPEHFLIISDGGHQLTGAMQVISLGEHPYVDFFETYGPLTFYLSVIFQLATGIRPIGEVALNILGFSIGYLLMFRLLLRISKDYFSSYFILALALCLLPQFYKYYCVLVPLLSLSAVDLFIRRESRWTLAFLAFATAFAGLIRHDFGVFSMAMALVALLGDTKKSSRQRFITCGGYFATVFLFTLPWLVFLVSKQGVARYFELIASASSSMSQGLSLPHPLFSWHQPALSLVFILFFIAPIIAFIVLWLKRSRLTSHEFLFGVSAITLAAASLVQASHRADFYHLLEGIPAVFICLALIAIYVFRNQQRRWQPVAVAVVVLCLLFSAAGASHERLSPTSNSIKVSRKLSYYLDTPRNFIDRLVRERPGYWPAVLVQAVRDKITGDERVAFYPFFMKFNYFCGPFAGGLMLLAPGYFDSEKYQQEAIKIFQNQNVPYVLWHEYFEFDGIRERNPVISSATLHRFIQRNYSQAGNLYGFTVYMK